MKTLILASTAVLATAGVAMAGGYTQPVVEAPVVEPVAAVVAAPSVNWTGFYAGAQLGYNNTEGDFSDDRGGSAGLQAGYLYDMGQYVVGAEADYAAVDSDQIKGMGHLKGLAGVKSGQWLYYGTLGAGYIDSDIDGRDDTVLTAGAGVNYMYNENWILGGEVLYHDTNDFDDTDQDFNQTTVSLKASYKF